MRTIRKNVALLVCAVLLVMAAAIGITGLGAKASTMDSFVTNNGNETDFQDTWGQTKMSADIIDGDKTLVCAQGIVWGFRIVNNYIQTLDGATFDADVYIQPGAVGAYHTIYYSNGTAAGDYFDGGGLNILIEETSAEQITVKVGWWQMNVGMINGELNGTTYNNLYWSKAYDRTASGKYNIKSELIANDDDSWTLTLNIDGDVNAVPITAAQWEYCLNNYQGFMGCAALFENQKSGDKLMKILFNDYSDAKRTSYENDEELADVFTALGEMETAYASAKTFTSESSLSEASDVLYTVTENKALIVNAEDIRRFEKGRANWYYAETLKILEECFKADEDAYALVQLGVAVNYFADKAENMVTERDVEVAEKLRQDVDYDRLTDLNDEGMEGAEDIMNKYIAARNKLTDKKDYFVDEHLKEFEEAVKDLSSNEKIEAAADLQKAVIIADAKTANREAYTERYNEASTLLKGAIKGYAGELANKWDIHNVTFAQANAANEIKYSASDYYNDDASSDVGITLKGKLKLDGLKFDVTVNSGDYDKDSWFGFFFTKERSIFSVSNHADSGLRESRGVITLIKPFEGDDDNPAKTQLRMGYPNLYGNETDANQVFFNCDLYGNTLSFEFKKEVGAEDEMFYNAYVTVKDNQGNVVVERHLARAMLASIVDAELDDEGMGYLTFGSCDKTLVGVDATIHTINGEAAATVTGKVEGGEKPGPGDDKDEEDKKKSGCGSVAGGGAFGSAVLAAVTLCGAAVLVSRKKKVTK